MEDTRQSPDEPIASCLDAKDVTPMERETVLRLRTTTGWWKGDPNALKVLREYAHKSIEEENAKHDLH